MLYVRFFGLLLLTFFSTCGQANIVESETLLGFNTELKVLTDDKNWQRDDSSVRCNMAYVFVNDKI